MFTPAIYDALGGASTRERGWPQLLRKMYGLPDNLREAGAPAVLPAADATTVIHGATEPGALMWCVYTAFANTGANGGRVIALNVNKVFQFVTVSHSLTFVNGGANMCLKGTPKAIPAENTTGWAQRVLSKDDVIYWTSTHQSGGVADAGGSVRFAINNGRYQNFGCAGALLTDTLHNGGGWTTLDFYSSKLPPPPTAPTTAYAGNGRGGHDVFGETVNADFNDELVTSPVGNMPIILHGFNDILFGDNGNGFAETLRFVLVQRKVWRIWKNTNALAGGIPNEPTVVVSNGNGGGVWAIVNESTGGATAVRTAGAAHQVFTGTVGAIKPYVQVTIPPDMPPGMAISVAFYSTATATAGQNGGTGTLTINGATPTAAGITVNGGTNATVNLSSVSNINRTVPVVKRLLGCVAGDVIRVTIDSLDATGGQYNFNWWGPDDPNRALPAVVCNQFVTFTAAYSGATARTHAQNWNANVIQPVVDEFGPEVVVCDLYNLLRTGPTTEDPTMFDRSLAHLSDKGHGAVAKAIYDTVENAPGITQQLLAYC